MTSRPRKPLAYAAYQELAEHYAAKIDTKPHNAYYERPAMVALWPEMQGLRVLDAGCGPGIYAELLVGRGAIVTAIDASDKMLQIARERLSARVGPQTFDLNQIKLRQVDMSQPMTMFGNETFDFINAPLCVDYIEDWRQLFSEFHRVLKRQGVLQFSCGHPAFEAEYYNSENYFSVEQVECTWRGFGKAVVMPSFRRSLEETLMPLIESGFGLRKVVEPKPTDQFRQADPKRFASLSRRPSFLLIQATRL